MVVASSCLHKYKVLRQIWENTQGIIFTGLEPVIHALLPTKRSLVGHVDGRNKSGRDGYGFP
jgi:hypothetical protein